MAWPTFMVLKLNDYANYMGYIQGKGSSAGYVRMMETYPESPYAKFEVELSSTVDGYVHIRSYQNNKYLERTQNLSISGSSSEQYWITATAEKPEEDQSKQSCTLFRRVVVSTANNTFRIIHVQSKCYLRVWQYSSSSTFARCVMASHTSSDGNKMDVFKIIDWDSLLVLPKYVAFQGDTGKYLRLTTIDKLPYLQFGTTDPGDANVTCEIFYTADGSIRIKSLSNGKFWRLTPSWIRADSDDTSSNNKDTLFRPMKVNDDTIALQNLGNNRFCKRLSTDGKDNCLNAATESVTELAQLKLTEAVMRREYSNIKYDLDNGRVYNEAPLVVTRNSASNYTQESSNLSVKFSYTDVKTSTWKNNLSLKLGMKASMQFGLPLIFEGKLELYGEVQEVYEWGKTNTNSSVLESSKQVVVPPMTRVTVDLVVTNGKCDVPFTYTQKDTLYTGKTVTTEVVGGMFTGANYYNIEFQTREEKVTATKYLLIDSEN